MKYEFNKKIGRENTDCIKWDYQMEEFGAQHLVPFTIADSDYSMAPEIKTALINRIETNIIGYTEPTKTYYDSVKKWFQEQHDCKVEREEIIPVSGVIPGISFLLETFTQKKDSIIVQTPVYDPFFTVVKATNRRVVENSLLHNIADNTYKMNFEHLEKLMKDGAKAFIICNPHNPVGRVWTMDEVKKVIALCEKYDVLLISDEIHWDLMIGEMKHTSIATLCKETTKAVVCTAISKTFNVAGLQTSNFIIRNKEMNQKFRDYLEGRYMFCPNTLGLLTCEVAYSKCGEWVKEQNEHLTQNAELVYQFVKENRLKIKVAPLEGTYLMWLDCTDYGKSSGQLVDKIAKFGAAVGNGHHYGENYDGFIRLNIACPKEQLMTGLECIKNAMDDIMKGGE